MLYSGQSSTLLQFSIFHSTLHTPHSLLNSFHSPFFTLLYSTPFSIFHSTVQYTSHSLLASSHPPFFTLHLSLHSLFFCPLLLILYYFIHDLEADSWQRWLPANSEMHLRFSLFCTSYVVLRISYFLQYNLLSTVLVTTHRVPFILQPKRLPKNQYVAQNLRSNFNFNIFLLVNQKTESKMNRKVDLWTPQASSPAHAFV